MYTGGPPAKDTSSEHDVYRWTSCKGHLLTEDVLYIGGPPHRGHDVYRWTSCKGHLLTEDVLYIGGPPAKDITLLTEDVLYTGGPPAKDTFSQRT